MTTPATRVQRPAKAPRTVDEYLARVPEDAKGKLAQLRELIRKSVPRGADEVISYGMPAFRHGEIIVWYAAFARHVSLFPGGSVLVHFHAELEEFKTSKGTVQFPLDKPLPVRLIRKIVKERVAEIEAKKRLREAATPARRRG